MKPTKLNRYHSDVIQKDYTISFIAGIMGGFTVLIFSLVITFIIDKNYISAVLWFIFFVIIGILLYCWGSSTLGKLYSKLK